MERLSSLLHLDSTRLTTLAYRIGQPLAIVGGLYVLSRATALATWTWVHFLRKGDLSKYKSANGDTWALVTGASDGIGKGFAAELAERGFNVVLHGRTEKKLEGVKAELQEQYPQRKFQLLVLNAEEDSAPSGKMATKLEEIKELNVRILVNNVAGGGAYEKPILDSLQNRNAENVNGWLNISCRFPAQLTRLMLPSLIAKPSSLILNICSGVSEMSVPYLAVYSGCKSFNKVWSRCLQQELIADNNTHVEVIAIIVGTVATERMKRDVTLTTPSTRQMASSSLNATGCGRSVISPYWGHAFQAAMLDAMPEFMINSSVLKSAKSMMAAEREGKAF